MNPQITEYTEQLVPGMEPHYTCSELAARTRLSEDLIRNELRDFPGVLVLEHKRRRGVRPYTSLRIPASVFRRWYETRQRGGVL
jgi:hypothetical protein